MSLKQQKETKDFFSGHSSRWAEKARKYDPNSVNTIRLRNEYVLNILNHKKKSASVLDIGCGSGDLVCEMAAMGMIATGIDFSEEMIAEAKKLAREKMIDMAIFYPESVFDFVGKKGEYDLISANGFIEYISLRQLDTFLELANEWLKDSGTLVLSARNRLFNLFSLNEFTDDEIKKNSIKLLLKEAVAIANCNNLDELNSIESAPFQRQEKSAKITGINVSQRYQYTPSQLIKLAKNKKLKVKDVFPVHIHGVSPRFGKIHSEVHANISNLLQGYANDARMLLPFASIFMIQFDRE
jgi:SAM-dependent methyltransferase